MQAKKIEKQRVRSDKVRNVIHCVYYLLNLIVFEAYVAVLHKMILG